MGLTFEQALAELKQGARVARDGWNGPGMWIQMQVPDPGSKMSLPYIYMKTADDQLVPWLASQSDLLGEDWEVADPSPEAFEAAIPPALGAFEAPPEPDDEDMTDEVEPPSPMDRTIPRSPVLDAEEAQALEDAARAADVSEPDQDAEAAQAQENAAAPEVEPEDVDDPEPEPTPLS